MNHDLTRLSLGIKKLGMDVTQEQLSKFNCLLSLLLEWNKRMNLTAIVEPDKIIVEHFLNSLALFMVKDLKPCQSLIDIGTGAGFPGIPIKIMRPKVQLVLLDSLKKRTEYLRLVSHELGFTDLEIIHGRAEDIGKKEGYRENFDFVVSRAVAPLKILTEYCLPFTKIGGFFLAYKGPAAEDELIGSKNAIKILGGDPETQIKNVSIPFSQKTNNLIIIQKYTTTPKKYPRSPGKIKKSPL